MLDVDAERLMAGNAVELVVRVQFLIIFPEPLVRLIGIPELEFILSNVRLLFEPLRVIPVPPEVDAIVELLMILLSPVMESAVELVEITCVLFMTLEFQLFRNIPEGKFDMLQF